MDLSSYSSIAAGLFIKLTVDGTVYKFSDWKDTVTISGDEYVGLGDVLSVTPTNSELRATSSSVTLSLSGINNSSITDIFSIPIKGSKIEIRRAIFDGITGNLLNIEGNPIGRFFGIVTNYSLQEEYDILAKTASNTIILECASSIEVLSNKIAGRRTNPLDQKRLFPTDLSMDRVPLLNKSIIDFGSQV